MRWLTSPIPSPSVAENTNRIWIVGSNHDINFSSFLLNLQKACVCSRSIFETASGLLQGPSCVAKGWVSRRFPVTLWYSLEAALKIAVKLSDEGLAD